MKIAVLSSTKGTNFKGLIQAIDDNEIEDTKVSLFITNKENCGALNIAKKNGIKSFFISIEGKARGEIDREMIRIIENENIDLIYLIGYMRILSSEFIKNFNGKILNCHPSLLPQFKGKMSSQIYKEIFDKGIRVTGSTVHLVTEDVDGGPILIQEEVKVEKQDNEKKLKAKVQKKELELIIKSIKIFQEEFL